jgi:hypothetical protein
MPIKSNQITVPSRLSINDQNTSQPAKGFKQALARLAKPFKGFASRNANASMPQPPSLQNKAPSPEMLAKAREQAESFIARTSARKASEEVFSSPGLDACRLKLTEIKLLIMDMQDRRNVLMSKLADSSEANSEEQLKLRYDILNIDLMLSETQTLKTVQTDRLDGLFDAQVQKLNNYIDGLQNQLNSSTGGSRKLDLQSKIMQAKFELMKLNAARDEGRL